MGLKYAHEICANSVPLHLQWFFLTTTDELLAMTARWTKRKTWQQCLQTAG